jgi:hypothetical protein
MRVADLTDSDRKGKVGCRAGGLGRRVGRHAVIRGRVAAESPDPPADGLGEGRGGGGGCLRSFRDLAGPSVLSLCSGIGGLDAGVRLVLRGARTVGYVEREAYCQAVLLERMGTEELDAAPIFSTLEGFGGGAWRGVVDLVIAGYPCQPFSHAGRRGGSGIRGMCGRRLRGSSPSASRLWFFWRMYLGISASDCERSSRIYSAFVTELRRQSLSRRRRSALRTEESGSLFWPTARAEDAESCGNHPRGKPDALNAAAKMWQTSANPTFSKRRQVGQTVREEELLPAQASNWPTPQAHDGRRPGHEQDSTQGANLKREAEVWRSPSARDWKGVSSQSWRNREEGDRTPTLADQVSLHSPLGQTTVTHGGASSPSGQISRRRLNPRFVCWLMGFRPGWTEIR